MQKLQTKALITSSPPPPPTPPATRAGTPKVLPEAASLAPLNGEVSLNRALCFGVEMGSSLK